MTQKRKTWILSDTELLMLDVALQTDIKWLEEQKGKNQQKAEWQEAIAKRKALADRINEIRAAVHKDMGSDGVWSERDQVVVKVEAKPVEETYTVVPWGPDRWVVVEKANPSRPVGEHYYAHRTHAHRKKRELNKAVHETNAIMAANGGALIL